MPNSPFDEPVVESPAARRRRRPWWRWNLITLLVALFALAWVKEFAQLTPAMTWLVSLTVFTAWGLVPTFFVPKRFTTMSVSDDDGGVRSSRPWSGNLPLVVLKFIAVLLLSLSVLHLLSMVNTYAFRYGFDQFFAHPEVFALPVFEFLAAAFLFVLTEIALRLEPR